MDQENILTPELKGLADRLRESGGIVLPPAEARKPTGTRSLIEFQLGQIARSIDDVYAVAVKQKIAGLRHGHVVGLPPRDPNDPRAADDLAWAHYRASPPPAVRQPLYLATDLVQPEDDGDREDGEEGRGLEQIVNRLIDPSEHADREQPVLVVDVLTGKGGRACRAVEVLRRFGFKVDDVVTLIDRQRGARPALKELGVRFHAAMTITGLLDHFPECRIAKEKPDALFPSEQFMHWKL